MIRNITARLLFDNTLTHTDIQTEANWSQEWSPNLESNQ